MMNGFSFLAGPGSLGTLEIEGTRETKLQSTIRIHHTALLLQLICREAFLPRNKFSVVHLTLLRSSGIRENVEFSDEQTTHS
jgi:hypothetical protein